jgi:hypothetical protein
MIGCWASLCAAETISLYTKTGGYGVADQDSNWDYWQQDQGEDIHEDAIYLGMFDGASGHPDYQPEYPIDGNVDGVYTTMSMGPQGSPTQQSLGVSGTSPVEFPNNQRDTRTAALFNLTDVMELNSNPDDINQCKFKWSIDYVMPWAGSTYYLQAPTTVYVGIYLANKQNYWWQYIDGDDEPNTPIIELQDEFDPAGAGILYVEKSIDIRVDDGPWGPGIQPLTNWYIENAALGEKYGVQFYELDFTSELKDLVASNAVKFADPNTAFVGFTMRTSLDGEAVYLSLDATMRLDQNPIPPTLEIDVTTYIGDFNADGIVNLLDFSIFAKSWLSEKSDPEWNSKCNLDNSGMSEDVIDIADLNVFCENWLEGANDQ